MDERACMSKQLEWNKSSSYGNRLSGKIFQGDYHRQTACVRKTPKKNKVP